MKIQVLKVELSFDCQGLVAVSFLVLDLSSSDEKVLCLDRFGLEPDSHFVLPRLLGSHEDEIRFQLLLIRTGRSAMLTHI